MHMELTPSEGKERHFYMYLFIFFPPSCQHSVHLPEVLHFLLKSKAVLSYSSSKPQGQNFIANAPTSINILIFSYISHGSSLKKSMTSELMYNYPLMVAYFPSSSLGVYTK